ncbi:MAG: tetratricopeptide repeat protein [Chitinophagales bacterium]
MKRNTLLLSILFCCIGLFVVCQSPTNQGETIHDKPSDLPYLNLHDTVKYVGMQACQSCHQEIYETFIQTGMGQSFDHATPQKSAAEFGDHVVLYDSLNNFYYKPFWQQDSLYIKEFRLDKTSKDTIYQRNQYVKYIVGSGQHTNSHIFDDNGYLYQAPITFYTQKGIWDLAPGFEGGFSSRFNRMIGLECMTCHNSLPNFVKGSENKYLNLPNGISCERCHGAGEIHVKQKLANEIIDTSKYVDYSIVNPKRLPRPLQLNLCKRCHLQGIAVLKDGKNFDDFKPAMYLHEVMDVFLPEYDGNETQFIMASQAHRMEKSACFKNSDMTCLTCHNPHVSVKYTPRQTFNNACINCHKVSDMAANTTGNSESEKEDSEAVVTNCSLPKTQRITKNNNDCSGCHMPISGSIDIPHVTIHDHYIRKPIPETEKNKIENFIGLQAATDGAVDDWTTAKGYLHFYESYAPKVTFLDSAAYYLQRSKEGNPLKTLEVKVHLSYLQENFEAVIEAANVLPISKIKDGWTAYRIGEAFLQQKQYETAADYFSKSLDILPLNLDFKNKLGVAVMELGNIEGAQKLFASILEESNQHIAALTNLGFVMVNLGDLKEAERLYEQALALSPDYVPALLNMAGLQSLRRNALKAKSLVERVLELQPENEQAKMILGQLRK